MKRIIDFHLLNSTKKILTFLVTTFIITWGAWWSVAYFSRGSSAFEFKVYFPLMLVGGLAPVIASYVTLLFTSDYQNFVDYHKRLFLWKLHPFWYFLSIFLPLMMMLIPIGLIWIFKQDVFAEIKLMPFLLIVNTFFINIFMGGFEEFGWRGILQDELEKILSPLFTGLVLALIWSLWHLPLFFIEQTIQYRVNYLFFSLGLFPTTFLLNWIYRKTRSIFLAILMHAANNTVVLMGFMFSASIDLFRIFIAILLSGSLLYYSRNEPA
jgi:membrane protease YdiL (CAAX protease family)